MDNLEKTSEQKEVKQGHPKLKVLGYVLLVFFAFLSVLIGLSVRWCFSTWQRLTMEELVYTLTAPITGTGQGMIGEYLLKCLAPAIVAGLLTIVFLYIAKRIKKIKPAIIIIVVACLFVGGYKGVYNFWTTLNVGDYLYNMTHPSTFIKDNYVDPSKVDLQFPQKKRNLIYVYLESMEQTYTDPSVGGTHKQNLIPELTKIAQQNESFSNSKTKINGSHSVSGTTFTMGGIFAATSGLPLKTNIKNNEMSDQTSFFDGVTTLGDILKDQGYNQTFMIGSDASFGGRDKYFNSHGNYQIDDYNWAKREKLIGQDYKVFWGYEDEKLFSFAKRQLSSLSKDDKPFNFTMLTVDTHFIDGYKCHLCEDKFPSQYENVMACSSRQVSAFIKWCQSQSWYKDTTIVLSGDHPTMNGGINGNTEWKDRKVYTAYINADAKRETTNNRNYATLDNFPTTLAAMGVKISGNKLGLGVNLFSKEKTLLEKYSLDHVDEEIKKKSAFMDKLQDVRAKSARQLLKEGQIPLVTIKADPYKRNSETINTYVTKIKNPKNLHITEVLVNASYRQDGAYGMNNVMEKQSDGTYKSTVNVSSILNKFTNKVYVTVYVTTQENGKYKSAQIEVPIK